jgi:outer membrane immunogenic protein
MTCPCRVKTKVRKSQGAASRVAGLLAVALLAVLVQERASAADWPEDILRGTFTSGPTARWDGLNVGGHIGVANSDTDYSKSTGDWVAFQLRETALQNQIRPSDWTVLNSAIAHGRSYGAFVGYNVQWDQLVLGVDLAYNRVSGLDSSAADELTRIVAPTTGVDTILIEGKMTMTLKDYASFRARAGYAFGQFLPYAFFGGAVGRFDYTRHIHLNVSGSDVGDFRLDETKSNAIVAGLTTGLGIDVALTPNMFLRGEWEFVAFAKVANMRATTNTARVGLGMRF